MIPLKFQAVGVGKKQFLSMEMGDWREDFCC